jgi:hypothetical protein
MAVTPRRISSFTKKVHSMSTETTKPRAAGSFERSFTGGFIALLVIIGLLTALRGHPPSAYEVGGLFFWCILASAIIGFVSRKKAWSLVGTSVMVLMLSIMLYVLNFSNMRTSERAPVVARQSQFIADFLKVQLDLLDVLETVKDSESAKAAAPKIDQLTDRLRPIVAGMVEPLHKSEIDEIQQAHAADNTRLAALLPKLLPQANQNADGQPDFQKAMQRFVEMMGRIKQN